MKTKISRLAFLCLILAVVFGIAFAGNDITEFPSCKHCGMNREMFSKTRMLIDYEDGSQSAFCSLHCASLDLALHIDKPVKHLQVADHVSGLLISAYDAVWVIGSDIKGVMTKRSKVAVSGREDALKIQKEYGGEITDFERAVRAAYEDMYDDTRMIREKRQMKKQKHMQHGS